MDHRGRARITEYCTTLIGKDLATLVASYWTNSYGRDRAAREAEMRADALVLPVGDLQRAILRTAWLTIAHNLPVNIHRVGVRLTACFVNKNDPVAIIYHDSVVGAVIYDDGCPCGGECLNVDGASLVIPPDQWPECLRCARGYALVSHVNGCSATYEGPYRETFGIEWLDIEL
jgi:hypothetical protein